VRWSHQALSHRLVSRAPLFLQKTSSTMFLPEKEWVEDMETSKLPGALSFFEIEQSRAAHQLFQYSKRVYHNITQFLLLRLVEKTKQHCLS
jgi:hypothetical protein